MKSIKKSKITTDEAMTEIFKTMLEHSMADDKIYLDMLNNKIKFLEQSIKDIRSEEPIKLFKASHKDWESKLNELETELYQTYEKFGETIQEQQDFLKKLKEA